MFGDARYERSLERGQCVVRRPWAAQLLGTMRL